MYNEGWEAPKLVYIKYPYFGILMIFTIFYNGAALYTSYCQGDEHREQRDSFL